MANNLRFTTFKQCFTVVSTSALFSYMSSAFALVNGQTVLPDISKTVEISAQLSVSDANYEVESITSAANTLSLSEPGASFIKVHITNLVLPDGTALEIATPDRQEVYHYSDNHNTPRTVDSSRGDDGHTQFSAMSVTGDAVEVRLIGNNPEARVTVDTVQVGYPNQQIEQLLNASPNGEESICGSDNKQAAVCFVEGFNTEYQHSKPVARILIGGRSLCTAWRVGPDNTMMTNNHCIGSAAEAANTEVWFNYQLASCGGGKSVTTKVQADRLLETGYTLDYSLFSVRSFASIQSFGYLGLDPRIPNQSETIYIPQHPGGRLKELSVVTDSKGTRCQVDSPVTNGRGAATDSGYLCDTEGGSSGSPVIASSSNNVIALHHLGGCYNKGAHISKIWPSISQHFPAGVPDSQLGSGDGQQPPVAIIDMQCADLSCTFSSARSYDSDGDIINYSWQLGDGATHSQSSGSHKYATDGQYTVRLTVTDNSGMSDSITQVIAVQSPGTGGCANVQPWKATQIYLYGDEVEYSGYQYQAKWWTQGDNPEEFSGQWEVWKSLGYCK